MEAVTKVLIGVGVVAAAVTAVGIYEHVTATPAAAAPAAKAAAPPQNTSVATGQIPTTTPQAPSTAAQTASITPNGATVAVNGTLPGTPITIVLVGGGTFTDIGESGATVPSPVPTLPFFVYTTPDTSGTITLSWTDPSGNAHTSHVTYGP